MPPPQNTASVGSLDPRPAALAALAAKRTADRPARQALIQQIEQTRGSKVVAYVTNARQSFGSQIGPDVIRIFREQLDSIGKTDKLDLFLITRGGHTLTPLRLMSLLREFAKQVSVLIPYMAHSAGTLISLGADEIVMGAMGELGPVDPSVTNQFNPILEVADAAGGKLSTPRPRIPISVEDVTSYLSLASERAKLPPEHMAGAFAAITEEVHPLALGNILRHHTLIRHLVRRLLLMHMDKEKDAASIESIIEILTEKLYAHDYLITREEAASIGLKATRPSDAVESGMWELFKRYEADFSIGKDPNMNTIMGGSRTQYLCMDAAIVEHAGGGHGFCIKGMLEKRGSDDFDFKADFQGWDAF